MSILTFRNLTVSLIAAAVNNDMRPLMENALDVVKGQADAAFAEIAS